MTLAFRKASKSKAKLRLAISGGAGDGKTWSALAIATALVPGGRIAVIDTEHGSASKYAGVFEFDTLELEDFSPKVYVEAIRAAEKAGYDVLIIDSLSHAWVGPGGALEMKDRAASRGGNSWTAWKDVTPLQNAMIDAIVRCKSHVIATLRAKMEYVQQAGEGGSKSKIERHGMQPVQRDGVEYEFDVFGMLNSKHEMEITKSRCPDLAGKWFAQPGEEFAGILRDWLSDGAPAPEPAAVPAALTSFLAAVDLIELPGEGTAMWIRHRAKVGALSEAERVEAWKALVARVEDVGKMKNAAAWLKRAIAEEDARVRSPESDEFRDGASPQCSGSAGDIKPPYLDPAGNGPVPQVVLDAIASFDVVVDEMGKVQSIRRLTIDQAIGVVLDCEDRVAAEDQARAEDAVRKALAVDMSKREFRRRLDFARWSAWVQKAHSLEEITEISKVIAEGQAHEHWKVKDPDAQYLRDKTRDLLEARTQALSCPPDPPNGGATKQDTLATDEENERAAIQEEGDGLATEAPAPAPAAESPPLTRLKESLAKADNKHHVLGSLWKYGPGKVPQEEARQAATERLMQLGLDKMSADNLLTAEIRERGWKMQRGA